jgi:hypothetical protein
MDELWEWLHSLDPIFAFLVALPFLVVAAAFLGEFFREHLRRNRQQKQRSAKG